jgi:hypothetical protein
LIIVSAAVQPFGPTRDVFCKDFRRLPGQPFTQSGPNGDQGPFSLANGATNTFTSNGSGSVNNPLNPPLMLSFYEGPGQVDFSFGVSIQSAGFPLPRPHLTLNSTSATIDTGGTVTVTYTYTPTTTAVPEPSTLTLLGMATATFGGYFGWRRRKQAVA